MSIFSLLSVILLEDLFPLFLVITGATFGAFVTLLFTKQNKTDNSQLNKAQPTEPQAEPVATVAQPVVEQTIEPVVEEVVDEQPTADEPVVDEQPTADEQPIVEEIVEPIVEEVVEQPIEETIGETVDEQPTETPTEQPTAEEPVIEEVVAEPTVEEIIEPIVEESIVEEVEPTVEETIHPTAEEPVETVIEEPTVESPIETMEPIVEEIVEPIVEEVVEQPIEETIGDEQPTEEIVDETPAEPVEESADEVVEQEPVEAPIETPAEQPAEQPRNDDEADEGVIVIGGKEVLVRYKRSFVSKLMQSCDELKEYYVDFVNHALSYKKVKNKISWPCSKISRGREKLATLLVKGKTMYVYLALDPEVARQTIKGTIKDVSSKKRYQDVPTLFKVKSTLSLRKAKVLFDAMMQAKGIELGKPYTDTTVQDFPYDTTENLVLAGLIKVNTLDGSAINEGDILRTAGFEIVKSVTVEQAHEMISDEVASTLVQQAPVQEYMENGNKKDIINIDTLSENFSDGDVVTLKALKQKGLVAKNVGHIKVLARGTLDKRLTVEANAFSLDAVKMIVLVGGTAIKR